MPNLSSTLLHQLTNILLDSNHYLQSFIALRHWATPIDAPNLYHMIIHSERRPSGENVRRHIGPQTSEVTAIILGAEVGITGRQDIAIRRREQPN